MAINQISLNDFRLLKSTTLDFDSNFNIVTGNNGAGKTSLLEAIHVICQGRSFKTKSLQQCINHEKHGFLIFARFDQCKAGLSKTREILNIHVNGKSVSRLSALAEKSPVRILNTETFELVTSKPSIKREFVDWCLFHVEQGFQELWSCYSHAHKQRNALLKTDRDKKLMDYWDSYLVEQSERISTLREEYVQRIKTSLFKNHVDLVHDLNLDIAYEVGWDLNKNLIDILHKNRGRDYKMGYTQHGIHRASLKIQHDSRPVNEVLSRGQIKRLSIALYLSQIRVVQEITDKNIILLIDDMTSELDTSAIRLILSAIKNLRLQIFISSVNLDTNLLASGQEYKMFHVEHGMISAV